MDAQVILKRFNNSTTRQDRTPEIGEHGDGDSWSQLRKVFDAAVADKAKVESKRLAASLHSLQTQNELLHHENNGLRAAIGVKKRHRKKSYKLDLQQRREYHGGAVFWSPRKIREARAREATKQHEAKQLQLQKTETRELKAAATLYKKRMADEAKALRQAAKEQREKDKKARAKELAAARALKKQQRDTATLQKAHDRANKAKRKASSYPDAKITKRRGVVGVASQPVVASPPPSPPPKMTSRGRRINVPAKYK
jgi:uncharacterized membrane protein